MTHPYPTVSTRKAAIGGPVLQQSGGEAADGLVSSSHIPPGAREEIEQLRRQVLDLQSQLERADRLATLGAMSGSIAHELNNMLTPLLSYASLALSQPGDASLTRKALEKTLITAERASEVTDSLLRSAASPAGPDQCQCVLREAINEAIEAMPRSPKRDGVEVLVEVDPEFSVGIGHAAMQQVAMNLILNACDAMRPGPGTLLFSACRSAFEMDDLKTKQNTNIDAVDSGILLRVVDTGPGIHPSIIEQAFEPLVTTKTRQANQQGGSGLGLTICRKLINQAGGEITVRSESGIGTCFSIRLAAAHQARSLERGQASRAA